MGAVIFFSLSDLTMNKMSYNAIQKHSNMFRMRRVREKERKKEKEGERELNIDMLDRTRIKEDFEY